MVGIGDVGFEMEPWPSEASANSSSSFSDASIQSISGVTQTGSKCNVPIPRSCAPGSSSSTLLRGGTSVGLLGGPERSVMVGMRGGLP